MDVVLDSYIQCTYINTNNIKQDPPTTQMGVKTNPAFCKSGYNRISNSLYFIRWIFMKLIQKLFFVYKALKTIRVFPFTRPTLLFTPDSKFSIADR